MPDKDQKDIGTLLSELIENEGLTVEKIALQTDIPSRFVIALKEGNLEKLPSEPYVRGYLIKIRSEERR